MQKQKTIEQNFADWEQYMFGFGYGTGEVHTLGALKVFFAEFGVGVANENGYHYEALEEVCGPAVAWLLINALGSTALNYGTSPRYGWLTPEGEALKKFIDSKTLEELVSICCEQPDDYTYCMPDACNCGPCGYEEGRVCVNPFWKS